MRFGFEQPDGLPAALAVAPKEIMSGANEVIDAAEAAPCFQRHPASRRGRREANTGQLREDMPAKAMTEALIAACHGLIPACAWPTQLRALDCSGADDQGAAGRPVRGRLRPQKAMSATRDLLMAAARWQ